MFPWFHLVGDFQGLYVGVKCALWCFAALDAVLDDEDKGDKWQDKISSGFDRLVAFASTELDKRRRSTEGDSAASCNTSPDSGIGHGEPPPTNVVVNLGKKRQQVQEPVANSPGPKMPRLFKTPPAKASPGRDSPPVLDPPLAIDVAGVPRTPSPSSPPPLTIDMFSPAPLDGPYSPISAATEDTAAPTSPPSLPPSVPLKYQRPEPGEKKAHHFKKKFFHRENWDAYDDPAGGQKGKFRPKGKDWNWGSDQEVQRTGLGIFPNE